MTLDLMKAYVGYYDWVKESNRAVVRHHFRHPAPEPATLGVQPMMVLHY